MAFATYRTEWGQSTIEISADFDQASCPVKGTNGLQVAYFRHDPEEAMEHAIEAVIRAEGRNPEDCEDEIEAAVSNMEEVKIEVVAEVITIKLSEIAAEATSNTGDDVQALDPSDNAPPVIVERSTSRTAIVDGFHRAAGMARWCRENDVDLEECEIEVVLCETEEMIVIAAEPGGGQQAAIDAIYEAAGVEF